MPFSLASLISVRSNRLRSPCSPTLGSKRQRKLYFAPGGHTHDWHTIPPDRLHISLSDPVLVAAEERLANEQRQSKLSVIKESGTRNAACLGLVAFRLKGEILSQGSCDYNDSAFAATSTEGTSPGHSWMAEFHGATALNPSLLDSSSDSCDIVEVVTVTSVIDVSSGSPASEKSRHGPHLAPLASETFKEELYVRGYLKRPASRPGTVAARKPRTNLMLMSRKVFPKVLGRRQGRKVAETLRAEQNAVDTPGGPTARLSEEHTSTRDPHADALGSPGTATSVSESFDLHEFRT